VATQVRFLSNLRLLPVGCMRRLFCATKLEDHPGVLRLWRTPQRENPDLMRVWRAPGSSRFWHTPSFETTN